MCHLRHVKWLDVTTDVRTQGGQKGGGPKANILPIELSPVCLRTLQEAVQDLATCFPLVPLSRQSLLVLTSCGVVSSLSLSLSHSLSLSLPQQCEFFHRGL